MRLTDTELNVLREELRAVDPSGRAYLFGSRIDDGRRGGDIDVFFEVSRQLDLKSALALEYRLISRCGEKVDLIVRNPGQPEQPIYAIARQGVLL